MKSQKTLAGIAVVFIALWATFEYGHAASTSAPEPTGKIGIVSIPAIINGTRHQAQFQTKLAAQQRQWQVELQALNTAVQAAKDELATLRQGTSDYLNQYNVVLQKTSEFENRRELLNQQSNMMQKEWIETVYQTSLGIIDKLAAEKGLDVVLERTEPEFPMKNDELASAIQNHSVLYTGNCPDLTSEVLRQLDAMDSLNP